jgi:hypothetical protein
MALGGCRHYLSNSIPQPSKNIHLTNPSVNPISISISFPVSSLAFAMLKVDKTETMVPQTVASAA